MNTNETKRDTFIKYKAELKNTGFFGLLKQFLLVNILGNATIQTQRAMANGMTHNKYCFAMSDNNELWLNPNDIECFWVEFDDLYMIRTKSGKDFSVSKESWYKIMHGVDYKQS